ncbi:hypothetical protein C0416_03415 [bacterium]|nr:hypothetical protein [bacterium]
MGKTLSQIILTIFVFNIIGLFGLNVAYAQNESIGGTLLPQTDVTDCKDTLSEIENASNFSIKNDSNNKDIGKWFAEQPTKYKNDVLACAIKTGKIHFWMIPYFIVYFIEFMIGISGLVAILFIVIGGYQLVIAGATDDKDSAKNTIKNALIGLVLVLVAWVVVNVVQYVVTI